MAELQTILKDNDFVGEVLGASLPAKPSKLDIDQALAMAGHTLPLPNKVSFHLFDGSKMFIVTWFPAISKYGYEKLTLKG